MKYGIISVSDVRAKQKAAIRDKMYSLGVKEVPINGVDGMKNPPIEWLDPKVAPHMRAGEWGVWASNLDAWNTYSEEGDLILFEDDAIPLDKFHMDWEEYLPNDYDFVAIWVPENQYIDITYGDFYINNPYFAKAYNGYGGVAICYSFAGMQKLLKIVREEGIYQPLDLLLYEYSKKGKLNGYSLKPSQQIVGYDWENDVTQIHDTPRLKDINAV